MNNQEIIGAILSKDTGRLAEAKAAIKSMLDARASQFRVDSGKFVAKSLFEGLKYDSDKVASHKAHSKLHREEATAHRNKSNGTDEHWHAFRAHANAAERHDRAAMHHANDSSLKDGMSLSAERGSKSAHQASEEAEAISAHDHAHA